MGVQKTILTRSLTATLKVGQTDKTLEADVGTLALGKPGDIWSRAYGPLVYATVEGANQTFGAFVATKGVLVNPNDVANMANFESSNTLKAGQTGAYLVSGAAVVFCKQVSDILTGMNARVIAGGYDSATDYTNSDEICVVEVNGFKAEAEADADPDA